MKDKNGNYHYKENEHFYIDGISKEDRNLLKEVLKNDEETDYKLREDKIIVK